MTYGEAGTARTAVGSGLWCHGLSKVSRTSEFGSMFPKPRVTISLTKKI